MASIPEPGLRPSPLSGWGRAPVEECLVGQPFRQEQLAEALTSRSGQSVIARGLGRSYGDSALNRSAGVLVQTRFNRLIEFDETSGTLTCEAGVSFADIIDTFLPRGWFLPTTPGTKFVTVGGAIAADVHGKNHHVDGSFGNFVDEIVLMLPSGEVTTCSPSTRPELFWATIGGMGLTGFILAAKFRLLAVEAAYYGVDYRRTKNLEESLQAFVETNDRYRYSVAWIDCLAGGKNLGRSVLMLANDAKTTDLPSNLASRPFDVPRKLQKVVPFDFPGFTLNPLSVRAFNTLYYGVHSDGRKWVDFDSFFYPLDGIHHWNRIYGRRGFVQYQALFPAAVASAALQELLEAVSRSKRASFLAVLKACGPRGKGMLSYLHEGYTLALDFPNTGEDLREFAGELDQILLSHGGRLYLAKDALMSRETFDAMYDRADEFRRLKEQIDPEHRISSSQARRLGLAAQ